MLLLTYLAYSQPLPTTFKLLLNCTRFESCLQALRLLYFQTFCENQKLGKGARLPLVWEKGSSNCVLCILYQPPDWSQAILHVSVDTCTPWESPRHHSSYCLGDNTGGNQWWRMKHDLYLYRKSCIKVLNSFDLPNQIIPWFQISAHVECTASPVKQTIHYCWY